MFTDLARQVNWLDLVVVILFIRILYIAGELGTITEAFKVLGTILGILIAFENYHNLSGFILSKIAFAVGMVKAGSFVALLFFGYFISIVFRDILSKIIKRKKELAQADRLVAIVLGAFRASLIFSLVILTLLLTGLDNFRKDTQTSFLSPYFLNIAPGVHKFMFTGVISRFNPNAQANPEIEKILQ